MTGRDRGLDSDVLRPSAMLSSFSGNRAIKTLFRFDPFLDGLSPPPTKHLFVGFTFLIPKYCCLFCYCMYVFIYLLTEKVIALNVCDMRD